jgi:molecular chaperone IbpA
MTALSHLAFGPGFKDFEKFFVGFDDHISHLNELANAVSRNSTGYPPYNITKTGDLSYAIQLAVAGFEEKDIEIEYAENKLTVKGNILANSEAQEIIHQGIANRDFTRTFALNEDVEVRGAELRNGLLTIALERIIPEHKKPKKISIGTIPSTGIERVRELLVEKEKLKEQE